MSDKITKTVTFEIEPSGDCGKCKSRHANTCCCFGDSVYNLIQLEACRDYLEQEKAKVYCDDCKHFIYDWMESECTKGNENTCGETFARNNWYCNNCKDREE